MSKHRDYIAEILSRKSRHLKRAQRWDQFTKRAAPLSVALDHVKKDVRSKEEFRIELLRYFPIGMIACLEGYFRLAFRDLIDFGPPYLDNLKDFKDISLNMQYMLAIHGRTVTLGEFVAHLLPVKSLEDINRSMSNLMGQDFLNRLSNTSFQLGDDDEPTSLSEVEPSVYGDIKEIFRLRHIFCHELAINEKVSAMKLNSMFGAFALFSFACEALMKEMLQKRT